MTEPAETPPPEEAGAIPVPDGEMVEKEMYLTVLLPQEEQNILSREQAKTQNRMERLEAEKKEKADNYTNQIKGCKADISRLARLIEYGKHEMVLCEVRHNHPNHGEMTIVRSDTGEEIVKPMEATDYQDDLPLGEAGADHPPIEQSGDEIPHTDTEQDGDPE